MNLRPVSVRMSRVWQSNTFVKVTKIKDKRFTKDYVCISDISVHASVSKNEKISLCFRFRSKNYVHRLMIPNSWQRAWTQTTIGTGIYLMEICKSENVFTPWGGGSAYRGGWVCLWKGSASWRGRVCLPHGIVERQNPPPLCEQNDRQV